MEPADRDFLELTGKISRERGFGCASYKEKCLRRRIAVRMRARGMHSYSDYAHLLDSDVGEYDRLIDALTINVTKLFRNWDVYASLAERVVPVLWREAVPCIKVWSAGCSSGQEPYSLAVLFHQFAMASGHPWIADRLDILGTDIDRASLLAAARAQFEESDFADTPLELRAAYFSRTAPFTVAPVVRESVHFSAHDLLTDAAPGAAFHLVTCRNVLIYFDRATQENLFEKFRHVLVPGGFLVLGKVETLLGSARAGFVAVDGRERIFRRL